MVGERKGARKEQSDVLKWVLVFAVIVVLGLLAYNFLPAKSTGNIVNDPALVLGWSFSDRYKSDLTGMDVRAISGGNIKIVNDGDDGKAVSFDGYGDYLKVSKVYSPITYPLSGVSVVGRFKTSSLTSPVVTGSGGSGDVIEQSTEITGSWVVQRDAFVLDPETDGSVSFYAFINGNWYSARSSINKITLNVWEHWAGTYDGSVLRLYKNGILVSSRAISGKVGTQAGGAIASMSDLYIGADGDIPRRFFNGRVDKVSIYNRALSASEIKNLYESPGSGSGSGTMTTETGSGTTAQGTTTGTGSGTTAGTNTNTNTNTQTQTNNPGTTTGNSGTTGDSGGGVIRILSADEFSAGKQIRARVGDITRFKVGDAYDSADLQTVSENQATFLVTSIPQIVILSKGESKRVDVNGDGVYDVLLTVDGVNRALQQVDFTLKSIKESVVPATIANPVVTESGLGTNLGSGGTTGGTTISPWVIVLAVLLAVAILACLAWFFISRRDAEKE